MSIIFVDNKKYHVNSSDNLLKTCLSLGINVPYFCWHPALGSVGACRQCAVKIYKNFEDKQGQLVMSCMTPVVDGIIISVNDSESTKFRKNIVELLMTNHPHDCPVCEEGGSCHLQDMTVMVGHTVRRYHFSKRTHKNQYLGPFISHEMNRCISCYRCVRYYKDYADGKDFGVFGISNNIYFGRVDEGCLENEFSGNLVEICPTGVFTDKTYSKKYNRKWDMQYAPSVCQHCCIGCNISVGERNGIIRRIENRYNYSINNYFLCDLGRFSYDYSNSDNRPQYPYYFFGNTKRIFYDTSKTVQFVVKKLKEATKIIGIGSCRASIESNFALQKLVGLENFSVGMLQKEYDCMMLIKDILKSNEVYTPTLHEIENNYDSIFILGEDITQTSPRLALSVRQSLKKMFQNESSVKDIPVWNVSAIKNKFQNYRNKLFITSTNSTKLDDISHESYVASIDDQISLGSEVDNYLNDVSNNNILLKKDLISCSKRIAEALKLSKNPLIISGSHSYSVDLIKVSLNLTKSLKLLKKNVGLVLLSPNSNTLGLSLLGGLSLEQVINKILYQKADTIIILENDLYRYLPEFTIKNVFKSLRCIIVMDHLNTRSFKKCSLAIPVCNSFENSGTVINYEGRAQRFFQVHDPKFYKKNVNLLASWKWLHFFYCKLHSVNLSWFKLDDVINDISLENLNFKLLKDVAPNSDFRIYGQKLARSPHRMSGRTALYSNINVHEPGQPKDFDTMFSFSMEGFQNLKNNISYVPFSWLPGWNSIQSLNMFQKIFNKTSKIISSGQRLFFNKEKLVLPYYQVKRSNFNEAKNDYFIIPYYTLFGNNELAQFSEIIKKKILFTVGIMNSLDANTLLIKTGSMVEFNCFNTVFRIIIQLSEKFERGKIGLPLGSSYFPFALFGEKIKDLRKVSK